MGFDLGYYNSVNEDLLRSIPPDSARVLEVGCGTGALATRFKRINPRCEYWGVEANRKAYAELTKTRSFMHSSFGTPIEDVLKWFARDSRRRVSFDACVFGDVLEHLVDPLAVLKGCVDLLAPGGSVVACIPNVQHWSVIQTLLNGDWPRHDSGLFDRTHLRWWAKKNIVEMFESAGLSIAKISPRLIAPGGDRLVDAVRQFGLVEDVDRFRDGINAYQYVVHAVKGEVPSRKVLVRGFTAEACCARPRLTEPFGFVNTLPGFRYSEVPTQVEPGEAVVVVRQRFNIDEKAVRKHLQDGCLIVGEWDDDPWHEGFAAKLKAPSVEWVLKACHAISVSTEAIADLVRPINPNVAVFPNQIAAVGPEREYVESDVVRVYMGGQRGREDWSDVVSDVNKTVSRNPDRYHFVVVHDRDLYEALETKHKTFYGFQPYEKYRALLRSCDVAIAPLANTRFNDCKSDITSIECAAEGVMEMRRRSPYTLEIGRWIFHDKGVVARNSYVVPQRMLCDHYKARAEWLNGLLDAKPELDRQLFERLPELKSPEEHSEPD